MKSLRKTISLAAAAGTLLLTNASQAAVTITFSQVGANVQANYSGSIAIVGVGTPGGPLTPAGGLTIGSVNFLAYGTGNGNYRLVAGPYTTSTLVSTPGTSTGDLFGYNGVSMFIPEIVVSGNYSPVGSMLFPNKFLSDLGAASFNNFVAWTRSGGTPGVDSIIFHTAVLGVPEPSFGVLWGLGLSAILMRRRRRN